MPNDPELPAEEMLDADTIEESPIPEKYRDRLAEMEKLISQVDESQKLYRELEGSIVNEGAGLAKTGKPYKSEDIEEVLEQAAASYSQANYWITIVTVGVCIMVLPGFLGYLVDQQTKQVFFGPLGILVGMIAGTFYLIRAGEKHKANRQVRK
jgi:F0F1-type ATP synthase assembly protein I